MGLRSKQAPPRPGKVAAGGSLFSAAILGLLFGCATSVTVLMTSAYFLRPQSDPKLPADGPKGTAYTPGEYSGYSREERRQPIAPAPHPVESEVIPDGETSPIPEEQPVEATVEEAPPPIAPEVVPTSQPELPEQAPNLDKQMPPTEEVPPVTDSPPLSEPQQ